MVFSANSTCIAFFCPWSSIFAYQEHRHQPNAEQRTLTLSVQLKCFVFICTRTTTCTYVYKIVFSYTVQLALLSYTCLCCLVVYFFSVLCVHPKMKNSLGSKSLIVKFKDVIFFINKFKVGGSYCEDNIVKKN